MKQCTYCGQEYSDEASFCITDGKPLRDFVPPLPVSARQPTPEKQQIIDTEHLRMLSIFHFVICGLALLGDAFLLLHYLMMQTMFANPALWKSGPEGPLPPQNLLKAFVWFYLFMGILLAIVFALNFLSGLFLRQRKHRTLSLVVGALNCLQIPFGTVLGVFTIIVLARDSVRKSYGT